MSLIKMTRQTERYKWTAVLVAVLVFGSLAAGCASRSKTVQTDTVKNVNGDTVAVAKETTTVTTSNDDEPGVLGSALHVVGEVLAFPFKVVAKLFEFLF